MRIAIVGAGLAGLAAAAAFNQSGHEVAVYEQADSLRASGLAINLWSNATTLLPSLGIPAGRIPGEPFSGMALRASGRQVAVMELPARGLPHVNVYRADLLNALAGTLPEDTIRYGARCTETAALAAEHDLVVVADGAGSALRASVTEPPRKRWSWTLWQAVVSADVPEIPAGTGASVFKPGLFSGIWRLSQGRITWFVEQQDREPGEGAQVLRELADDEDPALRTLARATAPEQWIAWHAEDLWPRRTLHRGNVVLTGDAAHAMLPTLGQGACQSIEDAATLAAAVAAPGGLEAALRRYESARVPRLRRIVLLTRAGAIGRRPTRANRATPPAMTARMMTATGGPVLRRLTRPHTPTFR